MRKLLITLAMTAVASLAQAEGFMPWTDAFSKADANSDGGVSMEEAKSHTLGQDVVGFTPFMVDHFADLDANKDGMVDMAEMKSMMTTKQWTDKMMVDQFYKNTGFMPTNPANQ